MSQLLEALTETSLPDFAAKIEKICEAEAIAQMNMYAVIKNNNSGDVYFSPSSLGMCLRRIYFNLKDPFRKVESADATFFRICDNGQSMHNRYQNLLFDHRALVGCYVCHCGYEHDEVVFKPDKCPKCGRKTHMRFKEMKYTDHKERIRFKVDGWLVERKKFFYVDFKSMNSFQFSALPKTGAPAKHVRQINFYMNHRPTIRIDGSWVRLEPYGVLMYENKNTQDIRCEYVERDKDMYEADMSDIRMLWKAIAVGEPPRVVKDERSYECKQCEYRKKCFQKA